MDKHLCDALMWHVTLHFQPDMSRWQLGCRSLHTTHCELEMLHPDVAKWPKVDIESANFENARILRRNKSDSNFKVIQISMPSWILFKKIRNWTSNIIKCSPGHCIPGTPLRKPCGCHKTGQETRIVSVVTMEYKAGTWKALKALAEF